MWWIRQAILQTLAEKQRTVRLPLDKVGLLYKISKASRRLRQQGDDPAPEEIVAALEVSVEEMKETMLCGRFVRSLDATFREKEDHSLLDVLPDDRLESARSPS